VLTGGVAAGSATLHIPNATPADTYRAYLQRAPVPEYGLGVTALALSATMVVSRDNVTTVAGPPAGALAGDIVTVQYANVYQPSAADWVGLYQPSGTTLYGWRRTLGPAAGSLPFMLPTNLATAPYELRLYSGADQSLLATSDSFTVTALP
jgi:hypothetical protein